jgi:small ligand-binding sensory domain FIST
MQYLLGEAEKETGYTYSAILCFSCCGRAMILGAEGGAEGNIIAEFMPPGLSLAGAYCMGEICPARYHDGQASNRFHNCSITFCML